MKSRLGRIVLIVAVSGITFFLIGRSCGRGPDIDPNDRGGVASLFGWRNERASNAPLSSSAPVNSNSNTSESYSAKAERIPDYIDVPPTTDPFVKQIDGTWTLLTKRGTNLELVLLGGRGTLTESIYGKDDNILTYQSAIANRVDNQILVVGLNAKGFGGSNEYQSHPSLLLFTVKGNSFQVSWRYADSKEAWSPVDVKFHEPRSTEPPVIVPLKRP